MLFNCSNHGVLKIIITAFFSILMLLNHADGQSDIDAYDLIGKVVDEASIPIEVGNVLVLSPIDSSLIYGNVLLNGKLHLKGLNANSILLKITVLGYENYFQEINITTNQSIIDLGTIQLKYTLMEGIEVLGKIPLVEQKGSDVIVNVERTMLSNMGTALDVLRNSPKVVVNSGGPNFNHWKRSYIGLY